MHGDGVRHTATERDCCHGSDDRIPDSVQMNEIRRTHQRLASAGGIAGEHMLEPRDGRQKVMRHHGVIAHRLQEFIDPRLVGRASIREGRNLVPHRCLRQRQLGDNRWWTTRDRIERRDDVQDVQ